MPPMDAVGGVGTVLVLGGGSEIAGAIVERLGAQRRRRVVRMSHTAAEESVAADQSVTIPFDARNTESHGALIEGVFRRYGDIDLVILAFGVLHDQEKAESDPGLAVEMAHINYLGAVSAGLHVAAAFRRQGHGVLVVMSSTAGVLPRRSNFVYGSSKAGLDSFARGLSDALAGSGASVMVVRPGFVRTKMTAGRTEAPLTVDPDDVAEAVVRGLERGTKVVWVPPAMRWAMTVLRLLPGALRRRLDV